MTNRVNEGSALEVIVERLVINEELPHSNPPGRHSWRGDFLGTSGMVKIEPNAREAKLLISIIHDGKAELDEAFEVRLGNPAPGLQIGGPPRFQVSIVDHDPPSIVDRSFRPEIESALPMTALPDGGILVASTQPAPMNRPDSPSFVGVLSKLKLDGSIDHSFQQSTSRNSTAIARVAAYPNGKLLVASVGSIGYGVSISRLFPDGSSDPSFKAPRFPFETLLGIGTREDGLAVMSTGARTILLRDDGSIDDSFMIGPASAFCLQSDGKVLVRKEYAAAYNPVSVHRYRPLARMPNSGAPSSSRDPAVYVAVSSQLVPARRGRLHAGNFEQIYGIRLSGLAKLQTNGV
jgi:hypothetical protein